MPTWMAGWGQKLFPVGASSPLGVWSLCLLKLVPEQGDVPPAPWEPTALSSCPKEPGAQRESCGLGWTSGPARGTQVGGQSGELDFQGPEEGEPPGGGPQGGGTHFSEGDILPFTTLKRLCSNFSPQ